MKFAEKSELVLKMKQQHKDLHECVDFIFNQLSEIKGPSPLEIAKKLGEFENNLKIHLKLENETFYPALLKDMKKKGEDTKITEDFISEMKNIETEINSFLENYRSANEIELDMAGFEDEFSRIRRSYILRVETEESGVFTYWDMEK